ncbi:ceramide glucosyltransferase [Spathaspora passalidarum NRRL Y-27907]|uniref:Ceramide glucosyltransferase n=1 Tax=Spathaspora passalidarum (strain NRRL Y-27907 / 11-Y1) TaxID=619300 RepID=G3ASX2_SPAPN|nr:ceramide glucosyltransferase [Spathaspora passalidarum NRRL Y-27907]EGW30754.1 ceramide glucosyltransferase [Spathaspora passalidarum NRRL Y-27907]
MDSYARLISSYFFLAWYLFIVLVAYIGFVEILLKFRKRNILWKVNHEKQDQNEDQYEGVTIIRPIKGIDPELSSCLESSFCQSYPISKLQILFCVDNPSDPAIPIIRSLIKKYSHIDSQILVSENFNEVTKTSEDHYGPNPKVNNLAKAFVSAKYDILWIMDSNVWASSNILKNSVITLNQNLNNGRQLNSQRKVKLVHHVPLAMSISKKTYEEEDDIDLEYGLTPQQSHDSDSSTSNSSSANVHIGVAKRKSPLRQQIRVADSFEQEESPRKVRFLDKLGAKLDEMFLHTSHSKFYVALNNVAVAPCVNGKSNMYRRSELDRAVSLIASHDSPFFHDPIVKQQAVYYSSLGPGHAIKFFARYIGEDNMIGIALWENCFARTGLTGDVVVQPIFESNNTINDYIQRRVRWLRVRKYMVLLATLIEPTTESLICGVYGTYAVSSIFFNCWFHWGWFLAHMIVWMMTDYIQYHTFTNHVTDASEVNYMPTWLRYKPAGSRLDWLRVWAVREVLALPIWIIAMVGHEIDWRGKPFMIKKDLTAEEM